MKELTIEQYKNRVLNILIKIDEVCRENGYRYMICYGTLLGAVRHGGFIPWDDDIDIIMPRDDYRKLGDYIIAHPELELNYLDIYNRSDTIYYCAKVCDSKTHVVESRFREIDGYGAFVDVFPMDYLRENSISRERMRKKELFWERVAQHSAELKPGKGESIRKTILKKMAFYFSHLFKSNVVIKKMHSRYVKQNSNETEYVGIPWYHAAFKAAWVSDTVEIEFEGYSFLAPKEMDQVLKACYGDYMKLPPDKDRVYKHHLKCYSID